MSTYPTTRLRRLRRTDWLRRLVSEHKLSQNDLIWTIVVTDQDLDYDPVASMPGVNRIGLKALASEAKRAQRLGIPAIAIFPHINPALKNASASEVLNEDGLIPRAIKIVKEATPDIGVIVDVALDPYTEHGHDGLMNDGIILNDPTVDLLCDSAVILAESGADIVAPSDMMDGRIGEIRNRLDNHGFEDLAIMSYAAKYASGFYGPYRDAVGTASALHGDKRTYQMDPANSFEALREVELDIYEGADMLMVKPGMPYLDIVASLKQQFGRPTYAFQVSGEYAMIMAAAQNGWIDGDKVMMESLLCFKRAGCDGILTYFAPKVAEMLGN
ncbi:MAG: porphobilinogen synthase [Maricaulaceae bacterium]